MQLAKINFVLSSFLRLNAKGKWWMPRHQKTMKDVAACEKFRGGGKQPLIRKFPNGETRRGKPASFATEYIGCKRQPGEVKHLSNRRKRKN